MTRLRGGDEGAATPGAGGIQSPGLVDLGLPMWKFNVWFRVLRHWVPGRFGAAGCECVVLDLVWARGVSKGFKSWHWGVRLLDHFEVQGCLLQFWVGSGSVDPTLVV